MYKKSDFNLFINSIFFLKEIVYNILLLIKIVILRQILELLFSIMNDKSIDPVLKVKTNHDLISFFNLIS